MSKSSFDYPREMVDEAWETAAPIKGNDPYTWRSDDQGNRIQRLSFATTSEYGWGIQEDGCELRAIHWTRLHDASGESNQPSYSGMNELF